MKSDALKVEMQNWLILRIHGQYVLSFFSEQSIEPLEIQIESQNQAQL